MPTLRVQSWRHLQWGKLINGFGAWRGQGFLGQCPCETCLQSNIPEFVLRKRQPALAKPMLGAVIPSCGRLRLGHLIKVSGSKILNIYPLNHKL